MLSRFFMTCSRTGPFEWNLDCYTCAAYRHESNHARQKLDAVIGLRSARGWRCTYQHVEPLRTPKPRRATMN